MVTGSVRYVNGEWKTFYIYRFYLIQTVKDVA
jgi:hypothetical protein